MPLTLKPFDEDKDIDSAGITNGERAENAHKTVRRYAGEDADEELSINLQDLLSDCMHLAHRESFDFEDILRMARDRFIEETQGEE